MVLIKIIKYLKSLESAVTPDLPKVRIIKNIPKNIVSYFSTAQIVKVGLIKMTKRDGRLHKERMFTNLTGPGDLDNKRDGFDTLIDHAPEKLPFGQQQFSSRFSISFLSFKL